MKAKGTRIECEIAQRHMDARIEARRVPYSGAVGTLFPEFAEMRGDVQVLPDSEKPFICEVKARANDSGFMTIEKWRGDNDALFLRRDRQSPLVVLPWQPTNNS